MPIFKQRWRIYKTLKIEGDQKKVIETMQTRDELYDVLDYHSFENKLDELFKN